MSQRHGTSVVLAEIGARLVTMLFAELAQASVAVAATSKRNEKVEVLADVVRRLAPDEIEAATAFLMGTTPLGRIGRPDEMARMALFLICDDSSYCTGAEFVADGGMLA